MSLAASCIASVLTIYSIAVICVLLIRNVPRNKRTIGWLTGPLLALCPLWIPANEVIARALVSVLCADAWFRLVDLARVFSQRVANLPTLWQSLKFLTPFPIFLAVFADRKRLTSQKHELRDVYHIIIEATLVVFEIWLLRWLFDVPILKANFALDHTFKLLLFVITTETLSQLACGIERLAGFDTAPIIRSAYLAQTVGQFWNRYNTRVHRWLQLNVFIPCDGLRHPVRAVILTFLVSAIFHELMFDIATSRFDGYQFTFFLLQAPAVLLSQKIQSLQSKYGTWISPMNRLLTILWFAVTSPLFFHGVDRVFPWVYASQPWLP